jgi:hypothetical protein
MNDSRSRRITRLEDKTALTMNMSNDPPEIQIVFVSPGGAQSAPMKFDDSGRLVPIEKERGK